MVSRPGLGRAISEALCSDCAFPCGQPQAEACGLRRDRPCGLAGGCPSAFAQLGHSPIGVTAAGPESVPASKHCHSPLSVPPRTFTTEWQCETHCHSTLIVPAALPLAPERTDAARSMPSGSVRRAAQHAHYRVAV